MKYWKLIEVNATNADDECADVRCGGARIGGVTMELNEIKALAEKEGLKLLDIKFTDLPGKWQHFTVPLAELDESAIKDGFGFDGSSIRGFQDINESDMILIPDLTTAIKDPFSEHTLSIVCNIVDPITKEDYSRDCRYIAQKAEKYLQSLGLGDTAFFGPEAEFFVFDDVRFNQTENSGYYYVDSKEAIWNSDNDDEGGNLAHKPRHKEGYFPVPPTDSLQGIRNDMILQMMECGMDIECHHHEVATAGQCEIDIRYAPLVKCADNMMLYKYIVKNVAHKHGKTATFMPKPVFNDNGSGMHTHQSIWKDGVNLFAGDKFAGLSETALYYIGGILKHARALTAFCSPTTNSFKRLVPGFEAPVNLVYSKRNRSAAIRIPMYHENPKAKRIEYRSPDASCNPYLAFSALLMAGLDGIKNKIHPGDATDVNLYDLSAEEAAKVKCLPRTLPEALDALEEDHAFLLEGGVFTQDVIDTWLAYKRGEEVDQLRLRPHPYEFHMYYDV